MRMIKYLLVILTTTFYSQSWRALNTTNGKLPSDAVLNIYFDGNSYIWLATIDSGIVRINGNVIRTFNENNTSEIKGYFFNYIIKDENSYYWFANEYYGIVSLHNSLFKRYSPNDMGFNLGPYQSIHCRTFALQNGGPFSTGGALWIGLYTEGAIKFDGHNWAHYGAKNPIPLSSVNSIAVESKEDTSIIWFGTSSGLIKYDGTNWSRVAILNDTTKWINAIVLENGGATLNNGKMYVGTESGEFCIFDGKNWDIFNLADAWNPNNAVTSIAEDNSGRLWIGTSSEGLTMYDGSQLISYYKSNSPIAGDNVLSVAVRNGKDSTEIWAACYDLDRHEYAGISILKVATLTKVNNPKTLPKRFILSQNYPNPFNPTTIIEYEIPANKNGENFVNLSVYNLLGEKVTTLVNGLKQAGKYSVRFNSSDLAAGIYLYRLKVRSSRGKVFSKTKKMILLK